MKFRRATHNDDGSLRASLCRLYEDRWVTCDIHMIDSEWQSLDRIVRAHREYDEQWYPEGHGFSTADILDGLATLIRLGWVEAGE